jgi:phospholipid/cholesterol/gamma-HCH transport system permease protein
VNTIVAAVVGTIARLGGRTVELVLTIGSATRFFVRLCWLAALSVGRPRLVLDQLHFIGNRSLSIIVVSGLFVGFVLGLQGYYTLQRYGSAEALGLLVALSLVRELGPVVSALLFAGRAGTSLTAEVGLMKAGEQLAAMDMMAVDPSARILAPRFLAALIALPLLAAIFSAVGILGAWLVGVQLIGVDAGAFWSQMQAGVDVFTDIGNGVVKSIAFGFVCAFVALYVGHEAHPTPEGVARATTTTVVASSLAVLGFDFILTALMFGTA